MADSRRNRKCKINRVEPTSECLTGRAGLALLVRYLASTLIGSFLFPRFGPLPKSRKGLGLLELFTQVLCFFAHGTRQHLTHFDELAKDAGYAATVETPQWKMASAQTIPRTHAKKAQLMIHPRKVRTPGSAMVQGELLADHPAINLDSSNGIG